MKYDQNLFFINTYHDRASYPGFSGAVVSCVPIGALHATDEVLLRCVSCATGIHTIRDLIESRTPSVFQLEVLAGDTPRILYSLKLAPFGDDEPDLLFHHTLVPTGRHWLQSTLPGRIMHAIGTVIRFVCGWEEPVPRCPMVHNC